MLTLGLGAVCAARMAALLGCARQRSSPAQLASSSATLASAAEEAVSSEPFGRVGSLALWCMAPDSHTHMYKVALLYTDMPQMRAGPAQVPRAAVSSRMASPMVLVTKHQERAHSVYRPCRRVGTLARRRGGEDAPGT